MRLARHFLYGFVLLLASMCNVDMAFAISMETSKTTFFQTQTTHFAQGADVNFAARAPPIAGSNVAVTGGVTVIQGSGFALHGQETVAAFFGFEHAPIAPNTAPNLSVRGLGDVADPALDPNSMRNVVGGNLRSGVDPNDVSVATASVTVNGRTEYFVSVSGKSYSGTSPDTVVMNGRTYTVVRSDWSCHGYVPVSELHLCGLSFKCQGAFSAE